LIQITTGPHNLEYHAISPQGEWIVASRIFPYIMRPDGSEYRELDPIFRAEFSEVHICDWSPDGRFIVFSSMKGLGIAEMDLDKGEVLSIKLLEIPRDLATGAAWHAYFSPDSRYIVYESSESGDFDIWISSIDGTDIRPLLVRPFDDRQPVWAREQSCIYFVSGRGTRPGVYRVPVDNSGHPLGEPEFCYKHQEGSRRYHSWKSVIFSGYDALISVVESESDIWILDLN
jgi:Tol biopolymer transport system component